MKFTKLHSDIEYACAGKHTSEDTNSIFVRGLDCRNIDEDSFKTYWEDGRRPDIVDQKNICAYKSVSVYTYEYSEDLRAEYYKRLAELGYFKRKVAKYCCMIRFKSGAGHLAHGGNNTPPAHCHFFKSDEFSVDKIEVLYTKELNNV